MLFTEILLALQRGISRLPNLQAFHHIGGPRRGPGGERKAPLVASAEAKLFVKQGKARRVFPLPSTRNLVFVKNPIRPKRRAPKVSKGRPESPLVASAEAKPFVKQGKARKVFPLPSTRILVFVTNPIRSKRRAPKVSKGRSESPLVASAEAKPSAKQRKARKLFFLAFHKGSVSCGRFRPPAGGRGTFHHWKVPKGCRGRPKGAGLLAAPGPPGAKQQCTASLAGARPAGFTSVPGRATVAFGAADPSPGSPAPDYPWSVGKGRCGRTTLPQYAPRHQGHARCVPALAPDWVLAPGQTKWRARYGPCRSRSKGKYPFRYKGGPGVSLGRLKGV